MSVLPQPARWLGLLGLAPQALALLASHDAQWHWAGIAAGCLYAALIFSFLGGIWWAQALLCRAPRWRDHLLAVAPSLIAFAAVLPWCFGWRWPAPSLVVLGLCLLASPLVDLHLRRAYALPDGWIRLRMTLSGGLGLLTLLLAAA